MARALWAAASVVVATFVSLLTSCGSAGTPEDDRASPATSHQARARRVVLAGALGAPCSSASDCTSGSCVDAVCCDGACTGQCQACDVAGAVGTCTQVSGSPHGARTACGGSGECAGSCSAAGGPDACALPVLGTSCGGSCSGAELTPSTCDGEGNCVAGAPFTCPDGFACTGSVCAVTCVVVGDCASGYECTNGLCTFGSPSVCSDPTTSVSSAGVSKSCAPYACAGAGVCGETCSSTSDCAAPNVCNAKGACAPPTKSGGCAVGGAASGEGAASMLAAGLAFLRRRRRGCGRPSVRA